MNRREAIKKSALVAATSTLSASLITMFQSCREKARIDWIPRILTMDEAVLVSSLVDMILPTTSTPGGLDMKVDLFIDLVIDQLYDEKGKDNFRSSIAEFDKKCVQNYGDRFVALSTIQREHVLKEEEANAPKFNRKVWGTEVGPVVDVGFYRSFKSMALWGYFSSQRIGTEVLMYDPIPGPYQGCIPLSDVGKNYSL